MRTTWYTHLADFGLGIDRYRGFDRCLFQLHDHFAWPPRCRGYVGTRGRYGTGRGIPPESCPPVARQVVPDRRAHQKVRGRGRGGFLRSSADPGHGVLNYRLDPVNVSQLYRQVGIDYETIIIGPAMQEAIKAATAKFRVERILVERAAVKDLIQGSLQGTPARKPDPRGRVLPGQRDLSRKSSTRRSSASRWLSRARCKSSTSCRPPKRT